MSKPLPHELRVPGLLDLRVLPAAWASDCGRRHLVVSFFASSSRTEDGLCLACSVQQRLHVGQVRVAGKAELVPISG